MAYIGNSPGNIQRGRRAVYEFTATNAQTVFSGTDDNGISLDLQDSNENDVYLNGSRLIFNDDYTIAGEVLTLTAAAAAGDILVIVTQDDIANVASYTKAETDARYINYDGDIVNGDLQISGEVDAGSLIVDTDVLVVDATNDRVGVGTATPTNLLHVKSAVNNGSVITLESTATDSYPFLRLKNDAREYQITNHGPLGDKYTIYDGTAGSHRFVIDSSGNVGIGTSSPSTTSSGYDGGTLHIHNAGTGSSIRLTNSTTGTGTSSGMLISKWNDRKTYFTNFDNDADTVFTQSNSGGSLVTTLALKGNGNVGIGTTQATSQLQIYTDKQDLANGTNNAMLIQYPGGDTTGNIGAGIVFAQHWWSNSSEMARTGGVYGIKTHGSGAYGGGLAFYTQPANADPLQQVMVLDDSGNVGIGAPSPENSLHIKNNTATNGQMLIQGDTNNTYIRMNKSGSTWAIGIDASDSNKFKIGNNSDLSAGTRLTVTTSGKVLINTVDPQDDPSMLRVLNSMSNLGGVYLGKVHNSTNVTTGAVLIHKLGQGQGCQFSGKFIVNSWTGNRHIDCHVTSYYTNDSISVNSNFTNSGGVSQTTVRLCTVGYAGSSWLAFVKDGGGSGVSYLNAFISGNIDYNGGITEVSSGNYSITTTHYTF